ncbi:MAG: methyltransferase domain-containing protein [Saprospiraceae bacterium]|nr:methyltransferase domain-containing protein [Saprospiraceae bacterium]
MNCNSCNGSKHSNFINPKCFFTNAQLSVVKCSNCGLIYLHPRPEKKLGLEYFENAYSNAKGFDKIDYYRDVESIMNRNKSRWELISKLNAPNHKILDFGAGQGYFVKIAQNNNWNANGVEISGEGRKSAKLNLDVNLKSALNELKTSDFGIITLWDVIEHLEDPKQTIIDLCNFFTS